LLTTTRLRRALSVLLSGLWQVGQLKAGIDTLFGAFVVAIFQKNLSNTSRECDVSGAAYHDKAEQTLPVLLSTIWQVGQLKAGIDALSDGLGILSSLQEKAVIRHPCHVECISHCTHLQHPPLCPENRSVPYT